MNKNIAVVELDRGVVESFIKESYNSELAVNVDELPFGEEVIIKVPFGSIVPENVIRDIVIEASNISKHEINKYKSRIDIMVDFQLKLMVSISYKPYSNKLVELKDHTEHLYLRHRYVLSPKNLSRLFSSLEFNRLTENEGDITNILRAVNSVIIFTIDYINTTHRSYVEERELVPTKKGGKKSKSKKRYINKRKYTINKISNDYKREYERHALAWTVRGHWRKLNSGKYIWVKPHIKGDKTKEVENKPYKITNIEEGYYEQI